MPRNDYGNEDDSRLTPLHPYFKGLGKRLCPHCGKVTRFYPTLNYNIASEECTCGLSRLIPVPKQFEREAPEKKSHRGGFSIVE